MEIQKMSYMFWKVDLRKRNDKTSDVVCDVGCVWVRVLFMTSPCYLDLSWHSAYAGTAIQLASCLCWVYRSIRLIHVNYSTSLYWNVTLLSVSVFSCLLTQTLQRTPNGMYYEIHSVGYVRYPRLPSEAQAFFGRDLNPNSQLFSYMRTF
jgi:hypothetical protein